MYAVGFGFEQLVGSAQLISTRTKYQTRSVPHYLCGVIERGVRLSPGCFSRTELRVTRDGSESAES